MASIHVIERLSNLRQIPESPGEWESGYWAIAVATASTLLGGDLFLHSHQTDPSHFGGAIVSYRIQPDGEYQGRVIFRFRYTQKHKGVKTGKKGWGNEKMIIF